MFKLPHSLIRRSHIRWRQLTAALLLLSFYSYAGFAAETKSLSLGVYTHIGATVMYKKMYPFISYLEKALAEKGYPVKLQLKIFPTYGAGIDSLAQGEVDFVRFGPVSYVLAKKRNANIELLAMESNNGKKHFSGVISVAKSSPIQSIFELPGKTVAFGSKMSSTGRYLAQAILVKAGIEADQLRDFAYLGRHDKVAFAVSSGNYDAGATNENTYNKYKQVKGLKKIAEFPCVTKPWVVREGFDKGLFKALHSSLLHLKDKAVFKLIKRTGFLEASDADYESIREAMALAKQFDKAQ